MLTEALHEYVSAMFQRCSGMKTLIVDSETLAIISLVLTQTELLRQDVFLVVDIDADMSDSNQSSAQRHLNAVYFVRPTNANLLHITKELKKPKYQEYHLFFSNSLPTTRLEQLAACDEFEVVQEVQVYFADFCALHPDLFSFRIPSVITLASKMQDGWTSYEDSIFERIVKSLTAVCLSLKKRPTIRFSTHSGLSKHVAQAIQKIVDEEDDLYQSLDDQCVLLLLDRRSDPVTPLLNQWTYEAMIHELMGIESNRVDLTKVVVRENNEDHEIVLNTQEDPFWKANLFTSWGDLSDNIREYLSGFQRERNSRQLQGSLEDMKKFIQKFPDLRKMGAIVEKHIELIHILADKVKSGDLLGVSELEQELACAENKAEHLKLVTQMIKDRGFSFETLKLACLFALRYEDSATRVEVKDAEQEQLINNLLAYAGKIGRGPQSDLFQNKSIMSVAKSTFQRNLQGTENVFTQYKPQLSKTVDHLIREKLKETAYPVMPSRRYLGEVKPKTVIVFQLGGTTYAEHRECQLLKSQHGVKIYLGGSTILQSKNFLADFSSAPYLPRG